MKFSEFPYERPDRDAVIAQTKAFIEALQAAHTFEAAERVFLDYEKASAHIDTMFTVANIRHSINTADEFYDAEVAYADEVSPELSEYQQKWTEAMLASPFRPEFEKKYGSLLFKNAEIALKAFSPEIIPDMQRENALTTEYEKLLASAKIPFEDGVYTISQMTPFKVDPDDARRLAAWKAEAGFYKENQARLDEILRMTPGDEEE